MTSRLVVVDDADPRVQYGPGWTAHSYVQDNPGNGGPPFQGTEHTADRNTTVSFTFTGTMVRVEGKLDVGEVNGRRDPDFECAIDGKSIEGIGFYTSSANYTSHLLFCTVPDLPDGEHTLTLNAVTTGARAISVDQFQYMASPMINIDNERVLVDATSDNARYSSGWESKVWYSYTYGRGESAILDFVGVSVKWYGVAPNLSQANGQSTAGYMVDGREEVNFTLPGIPEGSPTGDFRNVLMFETPSLSPGRHQLKVTHYGDYLSTPLSLDYVVVQNATIPAGSSSGLKVKLYIFSPR
ncbi:hypothetical protein NLJ89_g3973 [Agrocybe chaxingu]|uniref:Uncharacterized protein n=1 Tax=Agrocybe chaxingu TaxID=84603 RepID=A0A9W8K3R7_9AGAR|nr:hypothetical protein NLJ89_g3973 [Agrocybe chaxingu]